MTKEEAIKYLQQLYPNGGHCWLDEQRIEAIGMAVKALQEEPVSEDLEKIVEEIVEPTILNAYGTKELARRLRNTICGTSVSEDLKEASKEWLSPQLDKSYAAYGETKQMELTHFDGYAMLDAIEFGAQWQKTKDESTTEDLGDYINELSKQFPEVSFAKLSRIAVRVSRWQRNQDVKNKLPKVINRTDLDEYAYQCAYDMSNDWIIENPTWKDVEDACKLGANWQKVKHERQFSFINLKDCKDAYNEWKGTQKEPVSAALSWVRACQWQKAKDQETIELAEDHAMLAGMEKMKEEMMAKAIDAQCFGFQDDALFSFRLPADNYLIGSEVKVIIIKED